MEHSSAGPAGNLDAAVRAYGSILYRTCLVMLGSESDAEDAVQETFVKYLQKAPQFESGEHEKAWRLTVAAFIGEKKADQPLEIRGGWSCTFTK